MMWHNVNIFNRYKLGFNSEMSFPRTAISSKDKKNVYSSIYPYLLGEYMYLHISELH